MKKQQSTFHVLCLRHKAIVFVNRDQHEFETRHVLYDKIQVVPGSTEPFISLRNSGKRKGRKERRYETRHPPALFQTDRLDPPPSLAYLVSKHVRVDMGGVPLTDNTYRCRAVHHRLAPGERLLGARPQRFRPTVVELTSGRRLICRRRPVTSTG